MPKFSKFCVTSHIFYIIRTLFDENYIIDLNINIYTWMIYISPHKI